MDDDLSVTWLPVAPAPDERVDVEVGGPIGSDTVRRVIEDAPFDVGSGCVIYATASEALRPLPTVDFRIRALGVGPAGTRVLAEHVFHHTAMKP